jgi:glycosyltransferase involved in cell wall biosynthesis
VAIYVDASSAVHAKAGLSRYASNLIAALAPLLGTRLRLFQNSLGRKGPLPGWEAWPTAGVPWGYRPWRALVWMGQAARCSMERRLPEAELFHATEHLLPYLGRTPTVLTVHDLVFERFPQYHKPWNYRYLHAAMPLYCQRATAIIAISEHTRGDLVARYGVPAGKITVIPEAADPRFLPESPQRIAMVRQRYGLPSRYVLTVGTLEPRKNLTRLVDACGPLFREDLTEALVIVGSKGWLYEGFLGHLETLPWRHRVVLPGFVTDDDLPAVYSGAAVTVQPSLYEGFGLPVLEAMACGSPVCASRASSLPEVGGEAARYFAPEEADQITDVLRAVLSDEPLREAMRAAGIARAAELSWAKTAQQTVALYERTIEGAQS